MMQFKSIIQHLYCYSLTKKVGQATVEYAGALILAAIIVAVVFDANTSIMGNVYNSIWTSIQSSFSSKVPT